MHNPTTSHSINSAPNAAAESRDIDPSDLASGDSEASESLGNPQPRGGAENSPNLSWCSRAIEFVEENPASTAAGLAGALGVLLGAGVLGRKVLHPEPSATEKIQSKVADALCNAAAMFGEGQKRASEMAEDASARGSELREAAEEKLSSVSDWLKRSAAELAEELPGELERAGKRSIAAVSQAVKERPTTIGVAAAAAFMALGAFAITRSGEREPAQKAASRARSRRSFSVEENTREELYEQARKLGISGRSSMSKEELAEALKRH